MREQNPEQPPLDLGLCVQLHGEGGGDWGGLQGVPDRVRDQGHGRQLSVGDLQQSGQIWDRVQYASGS